MTLGNIGATPFNYSWLNKGWNALRDYAHGALTHFGQHDDEADAENDTEVNRWGLLAVNVFEHEQDIEIRFEVPGLAKEDLSVDISRGQLTVKGEKRMSKSRHQGVLMINERAFGHFQRSLPIPGAIDADAATAKYASGVLIIKLPKASGTANAELKIS